MQRSNPIEDASRSTARRLGPAPSLVRRALLAVVVIAAAGCATQPTSTGGVLLLRVSNELGRPIAAIERKACDESERSFVPIDGSEIAPGATKRLEMPRTCVDLVAYDARGRLVGQQRGLTTIQGANWVLRR